MNKNIKGYVYILIASFFFASIAVIGKTVINIGIDVFDLIILQNSVALMLMLIYFSITGIKRLRLDKKSLKMVLLQGVIGNAGTSILFYLALKRLDAGIASMLLFTHPVLISLYFITVKTKKITPCSNLALLTAFLGSMMVINIFNIDLTKTPFAGLACGMLASIAYAFYNINADMRLKDFDPFVIIFCTTLTALTVTLIIHPSFLMFKFAVTPKLLAYVCGLAVVSGILPATFLYKGIGIVGADKASIVATSELPITVLMSYIVLGEKMGLVQITGILLILCSIIMLQCEGALERVFNVFRG
ncbi:MAG TPA: DMT family transporter [Bacillota bacterium]|nr:DMT family transporter [Bacillota bacterium]